MDMEGQRRARNGGATLQLKAPLACCDSFKLNQPKEVDADYFGPMKTHRLHLISSTGMWPGHFGIVQRLALASREAWRAV